MFWTSLASAGPTVVPTAEGQIGTVPSTGDSIEGVRFESIRGQAGDLIFGGLITFGGAMPPPPEFQFIADRIHEIPNPFPVDAISSPFVAVSKQAAASSRVRNAADDGDFVAFSFAVDGAMPETMTVRIATFDESGSSLVEVPVGTVDIFPFDASSHRTGVAIDDQGRATVTYVEFQTTPSPTLEVRASRVDGQNGTIIDPDFLITGAGSTPDVALLDPSGNRLVVAYSTGNVFARTVDFTGPSPVVLPEFPIPTTPAFFNAIPAVAADSSTGEFTVVWESLNNDVTDPVNIRGRRFDAMGNPVGVDFQINTTTPGAQGQPAVAYGPNGNSAIVWAADGAGPENLDVFLQVYDAQGNPIGTEVPVNTSTTGVQDRPAVRFLPEPDGQGRPQVAVVWRDVGSTDGTQPNGTGRSYRCFSIDGLNPADPAIFADGFETGDTTSWSDEQP
ncbi:MAG: hypothetical protein MPN21_23505 [Thermoanaerobaculia bacterium]|nr:hypothetical protein [Thermoanaerobaculia bacterium]